MVSERKSLFKAIFKSFKVKKQGYSTATWLETTERHANQIWIDWKEEMWIKKEIGTIMHVVFEKVIYLNQHITQVH